MDGRALGQLIQTLHESAGLPGRVGYSARMSHFTTVKTRLVIREHLLAALRDLKLQFEEGDVRVRGHLAQTERADIRIPTRNPEYDIGFRQVGEAFECIADWEGVRGFKQATFLQQVTQRYAYHAACQKLSEQGFALASEEVSKEGRIHLVLRRSA